MDWFEISSIQVYYPGLFICGFVIIQLLAGEGGKGGGGDEVNTKQKIGWFVATSLRHIFITVALH